MEKRSKSTGRTYDVIIDDIRGLCEEGRKFLADVALNFSLIDGAGADGVTDERRLAECRADFNQHLALAFGDFDAIDDELGELADVLAAADDDDEDEANVEDAAHAAEE